MSVGKSEREVIRAAIRWWRYKRPLSWDYAQHLDNPTINTSECGSKRLSKAVAKLLKDRKNK